MPARPAHVPQTTPPPRLRPTAGPTPWVKACGFRDAETALAAAEAGVDTIGLNFYGPSPRSIDDATAAEIIARLDGAATPVGLFVNEPIDAVIARTDRLGLAAVQFHGDESPAALARFRHARPEIAVIRAFRMGEAGLTPLKDELAALENADATPDAVLVDARVEGAYGGTGRKVAWDRLAAEYRVGEWPPLILAGGLTPENVADAVSEVAPWGVDVAGGVESARAVKDAALIARFVAGARASGGRQRIET